MTSLVPDATEPANTSAAHERRWWRQRWQMILAGFCYSFLVGMGFASWLSTRPGWQHGAPWERAAIIAMHRPLPAVIDALMMVFPWFGTNITLIPAIIIFCWWMWARRHQPHLAMRVLIVQLGSYLLNPALKALYDRPRPDLFPRRGWYGWSSYPSGHAIASVSVLVTVAIVLHQDRGWKWPYFVLIPISLASLYSRVYLGVHWPTDVIGGIIVGLVWLGVSSLAFREGTRRPSRRRQLRDAR